MELNVRFWHLNCFDAFYVMPPSGMITPIIIKTPWQRKYRATLDWDTNPLHFKQEDGYIVQSFVILEHILPIAQSQVIIAKRKAVEVNLESHGQSSSLTTKSRPRERVNQSRTLKYRQNENLESLSRTNKRYIPKTLLQAQKGRTWIWVHK